MSELNELKDALQLLNLSPNAIRCYLESYRLGQASVSQVAQACSLDRSSTYLALAQLKEQGLLVEDLAGSRKLVAAKPPAAVLARLRTNIRRLRRGAEAVELNLAKLLAPYAAATSRPVLQVFTGKEGLRRVSDDILEHAEGEILLLSNFESESDVFSADEHADFIRERVRRGVSIRVIATDSSAARNELASDKSQLRQTRLVAAGAFAAETYIYGNTVAMLSHSGDIVGFLLRTPAFADSQRFLFEQLWSTLGVNHERVSNPRHARQS